MELYRDIHEMFKPSFLKYSMYFKIPTDIPLWKTNNLCGKQIQDKNGHPFLGQKHRQK